MQGSKKFKKYRQVNGCGLLQVLPYASLPARHSVDRPAVGLESYEGNHPAVRNCYGKRVVFGGCELVS